MTFCRVWFIIEYMTERIRLRINELIILISGGDELALNELAWIVSGRMLAIARSIVKDRALAEDVVQDSFVKILRAAGKFRRDTNGYAWICKIVHNTALNTLRKEHIRSHVDIDALYDVAGDRDVAETSEAALTVRQAMSVLSPFEKNVIYQKYFMDFTVRDSAESLGKSKSTVARAVETAEAKMREFLISRDKTDR